MVSGLQINRFAKLMNPGMFNLTHNTEQIQHKTTKG